MSVYEAARQALPGWVPWGTVIFYVPVSFLLSLAAAWIGAILASIPLGRLRGAPWHERARLVHPARTAVLLNVIVLPLFLGGAAFLYDGPIAAVSCRDLAVMSGCAALAAALAVRVGGERRFTGRRPGFLYRLRGSATVWLVLVPHAAVAVLLVALLPDEMGVAAGIGYGAAAAAFAFLAWGGGLVLAGAVGLARPAPGRLRAVVEGAAARMGVELRGVHVITWFRANAFAFPLARRIAFTDAALEVLDDGELEAIAMHELGHVSEPRFVAAARSSLMVVLLPLAGFRPIIGSYGTVPLVVTIAAALLLVILVRKLARRMEVRADTAARDHEAQAGVYARALEKLYRENMMPAVMPGKRRVHPHLYDRLVAAGIQPAYPRPAPPPRWPRIVGSAVPLVIVVIFSFGLRVGLLTGSVAVLGHEPALLMMLAADGGEAGELGDLAEKRVAEGDLERASALYAAAAHMSDSPYYPARLAVVLARRDRCRESREYLSMAVERLGARGEAACSHPAVEQARAACARCIGRQAGRPAP